MSSSPSSLFSKKTQCLFYNYKPLPVQRMLDFDYLCSRDIPSIAGLITPGSTPGFNKVFYGVKEILLPIYGSIEEATRAQPQADVFINFASFRSAFQSSYEALDQPTIKTVVIIAEGVPERDTKKLIAKAKQNQKVVIGPATVGGIQAGSFKIADTAGTVDNIIRCKLYRPGSVGFVSKSGGLSNEMYNILSRTTDGLFEGIAIGGDAFPGSTLVDHVLRFQEIPEIKLIVVLGELGGLTEYGLVDALKNKVITKPLVAWVSGTCAKVFPQEVQFGHAGARSGGGEKESAAAKNSALKDAGALVPTSFDGIEELIAEVYQSLLKSGYTPKPEVPVPFLPQNYTGAVKEGRVRRETGIASSICDDRGEEPTYAGVDLSTLPTQPNGIGYTIGLLWFKRQLPEYATRFIEIVLMFCADHGPCVSGAHNTIVTARAGKDLVSCLCSGLLTIGPRFGGAIDDAARFFKSAVDRKIEPEDFVEEMKKKGIRIPGIGHRIKSADNLDRRVILLKEYVFQHFPAHDALDYALRVEKITVTKGANLVLNVDGCIAASFLDLMEGSASFSDEEIRDIVDTGYLNGLFILARTIGLIGHSLDQKRLKQPLYRHPWDDVMYL